VQSDYLLHLRGVVDHHIANLFKQVELALVDMLLFSVQTHVVVRNLKLALMSWPLAILKRRKA
jgi:hypothetical protein